MLKSKLKAKGKGWLIYRSDVIVNWRGVDVYTLIEISTGLILGSEFMEGDTLSSLQADTLLRRAHASSAWPNYALIAIGDPSHESLSAALKKIHVPLQVASLAEIEPIASDFNHSFREHFFSPSAIGAEFPGFLQDAHTLCACGSHIKYKFCCMGIFREICMAMNEAEDGNLDGALDMLKVAKTAAGETAEILCRYAIVYSYFDDKKSESYLKRCLKKNPNHPRGNYVLGLNMKQKGNYSEAISAYGKALQNYPVTDRYHLNETLNNLGSAYYEAGHFDKAKAAWKQALVFMPSDFMAARNLRLVEP